MNRWIKISLTALALVAGLASAQVYRREAPKDVVLGRLTVVAGPQITMDGKPDRMSPGARIRDVSNLLVMPTTITGKTVPVVYRRETPGGMVHEIWLLTDDEYAKLGGGSSGGSPDGYKRFNELLMMIFGARR
jgi:hypothetical protein